MANTSAVITLADRMRRSDCADRWQLRHIAEDEFPADRGAQVIRHAAIHAGIVKPRTLDRFRICPVCEAHLDWPQ